MVRFLVILLLLCSFGCNSNAGPPSTSATSTNDQSLAERIKFIEHYVTFKRNYHNLEYDIFYQNNGGGFVPGPSDWDVRIVAVVPPGDVDNWTIAGKKVETVTMPEWVENTAESIDVTSIDEWYSDGYRTVGIDRKHNVVAYRSFTR